MQQIMGPFLCPLVLHRGLLRGAYSLNCVTEVRSVSSGGGVLLFCEVIANDSGKWWEETGHKHLELLP